LRRAPATGAHTARFIAGASEARQLPRPGLPEFAFVGRSNVGKSSLLNRLVGRRRVARVSKTPGRTQQINFFLIDERLLFVDLPGYGFARVPLALREHWRPLVQAYLGARPTLRGVAVLIDLRRGLQEDDALLLDYLRGQGLACVVIATKADKFGRGERARRVRALQEGLRGHDAEVIVASAVTGDGIGDVWRAIEKCCSESAT
jgi:GTP-binding protein